MDEHSAIAKSWNLPISRKMAVEVCNFIRGKPVKKAENTLERVIALKTAVPIKRYNQDLAHKAPHISSGSYPVKVSEAVLNVLRSAIKNAADKGLNEEKLVIASIQAHKGTTQWHPGNGRKGRAKMKQTHLEVEVREKA